MQVKFLIGGVLLAVLIIGGIWWWQQDQQNNETVTVTGPIEGVSKAEDAVPAAQTRVPAKIEPKEPPLPALDESDELVRESLTVLTENKPKSDVWQKWVSLDDLVRRFAVVVENATRGEYPRRQVSFLAPGGPFKVRKREGKTYIDPTSYDRYDAFVDALLVIPPEQAAEQLNRFAPLLDLAMAELGVRDTHAVQAIETAIDGLLQTPLLEGEVEVVQPKVLYLFADPKMEALPELSKQLLRMGPGNQLRIKAYLRDLQVALQHRPKISPD